MRKLDILILIVGLSIVFWDSGAFAQMDWLRDKLKGVKSSGQETMSNTALSDTKIGEGLKEALKVGIKNAVQKTGQSDGYLKNEDIKIPMPEKLSFLDKGMRMVGMGDKVDEFVLSMNRAAETAAGQASTIFLDSLFAMTLEDVQKIYTGGDTAATVYFKDKTYPQLNEVFHPIVQKTMNDYAVTDKYQDLVASYQTIPFSKNVRLPDLDEYVVNKALDGLFLVLGEEEQKIRTNPANRVTDLLREVFAGGSG